MEARTELMNLLHAKAVEQTIKTLKIVPEIKEKEIDAPVTATGWSGNATLKPSSNGELLDNETDLKIWAAFAQELEILFTDSSWMAAPLALDGYLAETHSKLIQVSYMRQLNKIQDALVIMPSNYQFWQLWVRFKSAVPEKPLMAFLSKLKPLPPELAQRNNLLSPRIVSLLLEDAKKFSDWSYVSDLLWSQFNIEFPPKDFQEKPKEGKKERSVEYDLMYRSDSIDIYQNFIEPLIEALVNSKQEKLVPEVIYRFIDQRGRIQNLDSRLNNLAQRLNRTDLASSWINQ
jgi:hypothetical protein